MPHVAMVLTPGFQFLALGIQATFELANLVTGDKFYSLGLYSAGGGPMLSSSGLPVPTAPLAESGPIDTLLLMAGLTPPAPQSAADLAALRTAAQTARRVAGLCTGAFLAAQMGLLDGKRATTHWVHAPRLRAAFPAVRVEEDAIFINEGNVWTSAGLSAGLDLGVALVEQDLGPEVARSVARRMVMHHRRAGGQSQHSELLQLGPSSDRIQKALMHARTHLTNLLSVEELAAVAALSPRQFSRAFRAETGQSPAKAVERLRLEAARLLLEDSRHSLETVARETGFIDLRRMREAFMRQYGQPPQALRRLARAG
ncbi:GlxA family transcriptional regulator [Dongia rigui]|uniref:GlxA family transcriptional regulator n=1 Tax=Dongia rigui TaxID=940149 RepID=A0ABU5DWA3_9PROT|nr:GlxA family transcriptional regulator [Dongia rigui]MDY0871589.1 GlxA family transcriptional regulator [Dongia rigui]